MSDRSFIVKNQLMTLEIGLLVVISSELVRQCRTNL